MESKYSRGDAQQGQQRTGMANDVVQISLADGRHGTVGC